MPQTQFPNWTRLANQHWKEFLPAKYQELQKAGKLQAEIARAVEQTFSEIDQLEQSGLRPDEAWEIVSPKYILLQPEPETTL